jgi:hypothetical protein
MPAKLVNKHNLPEEIEKALRGDNHIQNGDISVTTLIDSPQVSYLKKVTEYEVDITELIHTFFGSAIHEKIESTDEYLAPRKALIESAKFLVKQKDEKGSNSKVAKFIASFVKNTLPTLIKPKALVEFNMSQEFDGVLLSGTLDRYIISEKKIRDYKTISATQMMFPETKETWYLQQNIYAHMLRKLGYEVESIEILAIVKDWSKMKVMQNKDYPRSPFVVVPIEIAKDEDVEKYILERIKLHKKSWEGEPIPCTNKDRWAKADTYKVKATGNKRAVKNFDSMQQAETFIEENQFKYPPEKELYIDIVPAESFRCAHYCPVAKVCPQYQKELSNKADEAEKSF